jgi:hypothetical protein
LAEQKIFVYKPRVDIKTVRAISEKMKTEMFRKFFFVKPKPEEVQVVAINKYFEPYVVVDGEYSVEYSKNWIHNIQVDETMQELTLFSERVRAKSLKGNLGIPCKILQLNGVGRFKREAKAHITFDKQWNEVGPEQLPFVPFEEQPEKILGNIDQELENGQIATEKGVEILKSRIVNRPSEILCIHNELLNISERALIYKPMYKVTFRNTKKRKEATMIIDAITGKTESDPKQILSPRKKKTKKESKKQPQSEKNTGDKIINSTTKTEKKLKPKLKL